MEASHLHLHLHLSLLVEDEMVEVVDVMVVDMMASEQKQESFGWVVGCCNSGCYCRFGCGGMTWYPVLVEGWKTYQLPQKNQG